VAGTRFGTLPTPSGPDQAVFEGWYEDLTFTGQPLTPLSIVPSTNMAYYANWEIRSFTLTYDGNGATSGPNTVPPPESFCVLRGVRRLADNRLNLEKTGYILAGWSFSPDPGSVIPPIADFGLGSSHALRGATGDVTLYAHWVPNLWGGRSYADVDVRLYGDTLFDPVRFRDTNAYRGAIHGVSRNAARSFEKTFGIRMQLPEHREIVFIESLKNGRDGNPCNCRGMRRPYYLCSTSHAGIENFGFSCNHHSNDEYILRNVPDIERGLNTMFIAGYLCGRADRSRDNDENESLCSIYRGRADIHGRRSITSISPDPSWISVRVLQHEWSHNYGARDFGTLPHHRPDRCKSTCIMDNGYFDVRQDVWNVWCVRCGTIINANRRNHSKPPEGFQPPWNLD